MALLVEPEFWVRLFGIGVLNLLLSGDNALVIALAVRALPPRQRVLGQIWGALGAVALRVIFVAIVTLLLRVPLLQLAGGVLLLWIAVRLVRPDEADTLGARHGGSVWEAVWIIIVADITMSLDNVLAIAAAAKGELILVVVGIALSLPIVIWGAGLLARLMNRWTWVVWLGGGFLAYVAGEMVFEDKAVAGWLGAVGHRIEVPVSIGVGLVVAGLGWWGRGRQRPAPADAI